MLNYPDTLVSNNINAFGIILASDIQGHRTVQTLNDLFNLTGPQLSLSGNNTNNDALGSEWYVVAESAKYELIDWNNRNSINGWKKISTYTRSEIDKKLSDINAGMQWKPGVERFTDLISTYPTPQEGWTVSVAEDNNIYRFDADSGQWINILSNQNSVVTGTSNGLMSPQMLNKLNSLTPHPATHPASMILEETNKRFMTDAERTKLTNLENYEHPATHPASMILEETNKRFMTDAEKTKLAGLSNFQMPSSLSPTIIQQNASYRFVTDVEKNKWNSLVTFPGYEGINEILGTSTKVSRGDHTHAVLNNIHELTFIPDSLGIVKIQKKNTGNNTFSNLLIFENENRFRIGKLNVIYDTISGIQISYAKDNGEHQNIIFGTHTEQTFGTLLKIKQGPLSPSDLILLHAGTNVEILKDSSNPELFGKSVALKNHTHTLSEISDFNTAQINWNNIIDKPQVSVKGHTHHILEPLIGQNISIGDTSENIGTPFIPFVDERYTGFRMYYPGALRKSVAFKYDLDEDALNFELVNYLNNNSVYKQQIWTDKTLLNVTQLVNDAGYLTRHQSFSDLLASIDFRQTIPTDNSHLIVNESAGVYKQPLITLYRYLQNKLKVPGMINGTAFNGTYANNAGPDNSLLTNLWGVARNIKIGDKTISINGGNDYEYTLNEVGATKHAQFVPGMQITNTDISATLGALPNDYRNFKPKMINFNRGLGLIMTTGLGNDSNQTFQDTLCFNSWSDNSTGFKNILSIPKFTSLSSVNNDKYRINWWVPTSESATEENWTRVGELALLSDIDEKLAQFGELINGDAKIYTYEQIASAPNNNINIDVNNYNQLFCLDLRNQSVAFPSNYNGVSFTPSIELLKQNSTKEFKVLVMTGNIEVGIQFWRYVEIRSNTQQTKLKPNSYYIIKFYGFGNTVNAQNNINYGYKEITELYVNGVDVKSNYELMQETDRLEANKVSVTDFNQQIRIRERIVGNKQGNQTLEVNRIVDCGELTGDIVFNLGPIATELNGYENEYRLFFETGATVPNIEFQGINVYPMPVFDANTRYELSVVDGYGIIYGWTRNN